MAGYVGNIPVPQGTQTRQSFTATASQTSFPTIGYTAGFIDVYLNGIKLVSGTDFTASNGSDVVLTTGAAVNDVLDVVIFDTLIHRVVILITLHLQAQPSKAMLR